VNNKACPCLSGKNYQDCCGLLHLNHQTANTAEQLMRSRYTAFVMQNMDYLQATLHVSQQQADDVATLQDTMQNTQWIGLTILNHIENGDDAEVEFIAFYVDKPISQLHERSRFTLQQGQWFYLDGEFLAPIKLGRNDSCVCGSGKKMKRCHG